MVSVKPRSAAGTSKTGSAVAGKSRPATASAGTRTRTKAVAPKAPKIKKTVAAKPRPVQTETAAPKISIKLVRGDFRMPQADFDRIALLKHRAKELGRPVKKNELLRAGLRALVMLSDESLMISLDQLEAAKAPKPAKAPKVSKPARPRKAAD